MDNDQALQNETLQTRSISTISDSFWSIPISYTRENEGADEGRSFSDPVINENQRSIYSPAESYTEFINIFPERNKEIVKCIFEQQDKIDILELRQTTDMNTYSNFYDGSKMQQLVSNQLPIERGLYKLPSDDSYYRLEESDSKRRVGVALIICNEFSQRNLADAEMEDLKSTFKYLNYRVTTLRRYPTILEKLKTVVQLVHWKHSNFVCCISSYGGRDEHNGKEYIVDTNGEHIYLEETVVRIFSKCEALRGKPKMFFIQACRGPQSDQLQKSLNNPGAAAAAVYNANVQTGDIPPWDFLFAYSTSPGCLAFRPTTTYGDPKKPYFISELCKALMSFHKQLDILSILQKVNCALYDSTWQHKGKEVRQVSWSKSSLRFPVFLSNEALISFLTQYYCIHPSIHS